MIVGNVLLKGSTNKREDTKNLLSGLTGRKDFFEKTGVVFDEVLATFGWSDFLIRLYGVNAEVIKLAVVTLRDMIEKILDDKYVETSTIIGITVGKKSGLIESKEAFLKRYKESIRRGEDGFPSTPTIEGELEKKIKEYISELPTNDIF